MSTGWSASDIPDQSGRVAVVTGANSGLGLATATRAGPGRGEGRDGLPRPRPRRSRRSQQVRSTVPGAELELAPLDLASLASVSELAEALIAEHGAIDLLINNAGVMATPRRLTEDGFELQFGTNHLGHFALTARLLPALLRGEGSRVVTVSSIAHRTGRIRLRRPERRAPLLPLGRLRAIEARQPPLRLRARAPRRGRGGAAGEHGGPPRLLGHQPAVLRPRPRRGDRSPPPTRLAMAVANRLVAQSGDDGALPSLYAATFPGLPGGSFVGPDGPFEAQGRPAGGRLQLGLEGPGGGEAALEVSEELTGVSFDFG